MLKLAGPFCLLFVVSLFLLHTQADAAHALRAGPLDEAAIRWTRIAADLEETVPPQLLLGAKGSDASLDAALSGAQISRSQFQQDAVAVSGAVGACGDEAAREALAISLANLPLPEGIAFPEASMSDVRVRSASLEAARSLVLSLVARMRTPDPSGAKK